jgi:hypothetical protein
MTHHFYIIIAIAVVLGFAVLLYLDRDLYDRLFNRWTKWEIHEENLPYIQTTYCSPLLGHYETGRSSVLVDIYVRTHKFNGLKEYKKIVKR